MYYVAVDMILTNKAVLGLCLSTSLSLMLYYCTVRVSVWSQQCTSVVQSMTEFFEWVCDTVRNHAVMALRYHSAWAGWLYVHTESERVLDWILSSFCFFLQ